MKSFVWVHPKGRKFGLHKTKLSAGVFTPVGSSQIRSDLMLHFWITEIETG